MRFNHSLDLQVEETAVVVVLSGMSEIEDAAFDTPLSDLAVSNDDSFNPAQILGRRFGPFDGPVQDNFDFGTQIWSLLNSRLRALDDLQSRVATAMALRCPRMRQRALENILLEPYYISSPQEQGSVEPGFIGAAASATDVATANDEIFSSKGRWLPGITYDDITVEEPEFWNRFQNSNNKNNIGINEIMHKDDEDVFFFDFDADDDPQPMDIFPIDVPMPMEMPYPPHHHEYDEHHHHHDHFHHDHEHHHDHREHHEHEERVRSRSRGAGIQTKPLLFNPFFNHHEHNHDDADDDIHHQHHHHLPKTSNARQPLRPEDFFTTTVYTDYFSDNNHYPGSIVMIKEPEDSEDEFVNWQLWDDDGSLNSGLILFVALCAACAVVWTALLLQCATMGYAWVVCCSSNGAGNDGCNRRGQFMVLASESEDDGEEEEEEEENDLKRLKRETTKVVIAADYTKTIAKC
jgi:hypothetical protein